MSFYNENTVEVTYNGKTTRVSKEDAHIYEKLSQPKVKKEKKESKKAE